MREQEFISWLHARWLPIQEQKSLPKWQLEDTRALAQEELFDRLEEQGVALDRVSFMALADEQESPEELTESLLQEGAFNEQEIGQIYLLLFELWRRLMSEKPCLSIFCNELDYQIAHYDLDENPDYEGIQDILSNLAIVLQENQEEHLAGQELFLAICDHCFFDVEGFLYGVVADEIDHKNLSYAAELVEDFSPHIQDKKWFHLLEARLFAFTDESALPEAIEKCMKSALKDTQDLDYRLELLAFLAQADEHNVFMKLIKQTVSLIQTEEEFRELLQIYADYLHERDLLDQEERVRSLLLEKDPKQLQMKMMQKEFPF